MTPPPNIHNLLRQRLLERANLAPLPQPIPGFSIQDLFDSQWSNEFERLMRNRLVMGSLRYGRLKSGHKQQYDRVGSCIRRLNRYSLTGNLEMLVDVANLCLVEYLEGNHPLRHFAAEDDGEHSKAIN